jgi:hypothetical protein
MDGQRSGRAERLARAIDAQFESWHLTPTQREVALMLLKGDEHNAIAARAGRSEGRRAPACRDRRAGQARGATLQPNARVGHRAVVR